MGGEVWPRVPLFGLRIAQAAFMDQVAAGFDRAAPAA